MSRFQLVDDHRDTYEVKRLCECVDIERSSYYAWKAAAPARAARAAADAGVAARIRAVHGEDATYGAPRVTAELNDGVGAGQRVNLNQCRQQLPTTAADNSLAESFNAALKREVLRDDAAWPDEVTCRRRVFRWVARYNTRRRHSWCGHQCPDAFETGNAVTLAAAA